VRVTSREIPGWVREGDYQEDPQFRARFQAWLSEIWELKDARISELLAGRPSA
jgi:hypothetical protein